VAGGRDARRLFFFFFAGVLALAQGRKRPLHALRRFADGAAAAAAVRWFDDASCRGLLVPCRCKFDHVDRLGIEHGGISSQR
jgi:hypothetical protein